MTTGDVINAFIERIGTEIDWKYLKSQRCLKKTSGNLVFEIDFFSSKWNSPDSVEINGDFRLWTKERGKTCNVNSLVCFISYRNGDKYWYDITDSASQRQTYEKMLGDIKATAVFLYDRFEADYKAACRLLLKESYFHKFNVFLDFIADSLGIASLREIAGKEYAAYSHDLKQDIERYRSGEDISPAWTANRSNVKFIADNLSLLCGPDL